MYESRAVDCLSLLCITACSNAEWVHPNKSKDNFTLDYNKCQSESMLDPKNQQGNSYFALQATERCLGEKGLGLAREA